MDEDIVVATLLGALIASTVGFALAWLGASRRARRLEDMVGPSSALEDRTTGLEQAMGALQGDVDRLRAGHEFLSRLVTEHRARSRPRLGAGPAEMDTPH